MLVENSTLENTAANRATVRLEKRRRRRKRALQILIGVFVVMLLGVGAGFFWLQSIQGKMQLGPDEAGAVKEVIAAPEGQAINILLVGTDMRPGLRSSRADTIVFIRVDKAEKNAYMVSIPRDTRVEIPDRGLDKINHAWAYGQAPLLIETVSDFLGLPVNYFFQVDFDKFEKAVDALGGVEFATETSWYDGELRVAVRSGMNRRYGREAMALIRNRSWGGLSGGDIGRVSTQQDFLKAMLAQSVQSYADVPRVANVVASYVNTNMGLAEMLSSGRIFAGSDLDIDSTVLTGKGAMIGGVSYIVPDEEAKDALVSAMLNNEPLTVETTPTP